MFLLICLHAVVQILGLSALWERCEWFSCRT